MAGSVPVYNENKAELQAVSQPLYNLQRKKNCQAHKKV